MSPTTSQEKAKHVRPPIVAVLGHVDHGKSTLLDYIRKSNTVDGEAGGITQHVAAYEAEHRLKDGTQKRITFIDTPGHAAFTAIRKRGASIADVAILVVSAEDGVKEQTIEALGSIRESGIPFVVAITKIDKPNADVEKTKTSLLKNEIYIEGLGGDVPWTAVSSKTGEGIPELLEILLLVAEMENVTGQPEKEAEGFVIESHRDPKRGIAATLIITDGSMRSGMAVVSGGALAPLRIMENFTGATLKEASFSSPVRVYGFDSLPEVGAPFKAYKNKKVAEVARQEHILHAPKKQQVVESREEGTFVLPIIVKADTTGSLEAIVGQTQTLTTARARIRVIHSGIGSISENDVKGALSSRADVIIIGFNVSVDSAAEELARQNNVSVETFSIIYDLTERLSEILKKWTPKHTVEDILGHAKVVRVFSQKKTSTVLGGKVQDGYLSANHLVNVLRRDIKIGVGKLQNIQTQKQDVARVDEGGEFGAQIKSEFEIAPGDTLECFTEREE